MPRTFKEYHLVDLLTGESLGGFTTLAGAREEARASGLTSSPLRGCGSETTGGEPTQRSS
jgi:hypothetical protein